jgi:hypothetical protein
MKTTILPWSLSLTGTSKRKKNFTSSKFVFFSPYTLVESVYIKNHQTFADKLKAYVSRENQVSLTYNQL